MSLLKAAALVLGLLAPMAIALPTSAATLNITKQDANGWVFNDANGQNAWYIGASYTVNGQSRNNIAAGVFRLQATNPLDGNVRKFMAFCMSPLSWLRLPLDYTTGNSLNRTALTRLSALANGAWSQISNSKTAGAFQLAVWEVVSEAGGLDLATGNFVLNRTSSNAAKRMAQDWLDQVANGGFRPSPYRITTLTAVNTQDLMTNDPSPVPLPAGLGLLALGLAALAAAKGQRAVV